MDHHQWHASVKSLYTRLNSARDCIMIQTDASWRRSTSSLLPELHLASLDCIRKLLAMCKIFHSTTESCSELCRVGSRLPLGKQINLITLLHTAAEECLVVMHLTAPKDDPQLVRWRAAMGCIRLTDPLQAE